MRIKLKLKKLSARGHDKHHTFPTALKSSNTCSGPCKECKIACPS